VRCFGQDLKTFFETENRISTEIVEAVARRVMQIELEGANSEAPENCSHQQWYLRGIGHVYQWNKSGFEHALESFRRAIELNPQFAPAYGMAAYCYVQKKSYGLMSDRRSENTECEFLAQKAADFATDDPTTLSRAAHAVASVTGNIDGAAILIEQALKLNPASGLSWYVSGWLQLFQGRPRIGMEHLGRAMGLSLPDPLRFKMRAALAYSHFMQGQYDEAGDAAVKAIASQPGYLTAMRVAAASHALAGRREQAQKLMKVIHERDPALRISNVCHLLPFRREQDLTRWTDGLRKAGLPA
jgi:tetratricopeptide (TPR) repeat protein